MYGSILRIKRYIIIFINYRILFALLTNNKKYIIYYIRNIWKKKKCAANSLMTTTTKNPLGSLRTAVTFRVADYSDDDSLVE